jgi:hypothetical protein
MARVRRIAVGVASGLGLLLGAAWLGLRVEPAPFPPYPDRPAVRNAVALPAGLPPPVERYARLALGDRVPRTDSAVLTGRGRLRLSGMTFPARLRFVHAAGRAYRHDVDATVFGWPLMRINERYVDGRARLELPVGVVADEPKVDQGANLALWGEEVFWLPSVLFVDPRVCWEPVDATSARLVVPFGATEDGFTVTFDAATGLLRRLEALRYRSASDAAKIPRSIEPLGWRELGGMRLPSPVAVTWADEGTPWLVMAVEEATYNVDVTARLQAAGT